MKKYYFLSYIGNKKDSPLSYRNSITACGLMEVNDSSLIEIVKDIADKHELVEKSIIITCMKDLTEEEYKMLNGK